MSENVNAYHGEWGASDFGGVLVRADELFGEVARRVGLDENEYATHRSQKQLDVSETGTHQTGNPNAVPAVDHNDQVRHHVNQRPRHTLK